MATLCTEWPSGISTFIRAYGSLVWYNTPDEVKRLKSLSYPALKAELTTIFPDCLGEVNEILGVASFPLKRQHAQNYVKSGIALVGDAAHMINPLAGQGVNIGLLDAAALGEVLIEASKNGQDYWLSFSFNAL